MSLRISRLKNISFSSYFKAIATLSLGRLVGAALPILAAPILGRLYLPADYGLLATYMAVANVFGSLSTLQFQQGIIVEKSDKNAIILVGICLISSVLVAIFALGFVFLTIHFSSAGSSYQNLGPWFVLLPISVFIGGAISGVASLANRHKKYLFLARTNVVTVSVTVSASIIFGWLGFSSTGLLISYFIGQAVALVVHIILACQIIKTWPISSLDKAIAVALKHRKFPFYSAPSVLLQSFSKQLPILVLSSLSSISLLGAFSRARQLLSLPMQLLGSSIGLVFRQRASENYHDTGSCKALYSTTLFWLTLLALPPVALLMIFSPDLFRIVLGPNWGVAGEVARILAPMLLLGFICSPVSNVFYILNAQKEELKLSICSAVLLVVFIGGALMFLSEEPVAIIYAFSVSYSITYLLYIYAGWRLVSS